MYKCNALQFSYRHAPIGGFNKGFLVTEEALDLLINKRGVLVLKLFRWVIFSGYALDETRIFLIMIVHFLYLMSMVL